MRLTGSLDGIGLESLRGSTRVQTLDLSGCRGISPCFIATLRGTPLRTLLLGGSDINNFGIAALAALGLPLSKLDISRTIVDDKGLEKLRGLSHLSVLVFWGFNEFTVTAKGVRALSQLTVSDLEFSVPEHSELEEDERFDFDSLREIRGMPLTSLKVSDNQSLGNEGFSGLVGMPLTNLKIECGGSLTNQGMFCLRGMALCNLDLVFDGDGGISLDGLIVLKGMPLASLCLAGSFLICDGFLELLKGAPLTDLHLNAEENDCQLTDTGLAVLSSLPLTSLVLKERRSQITDRGVAGLKGLRLTDFTLEGAENIGDLALKTLKDMPLTNLTMDGCHDVTDAGIKYIANLPLTYLRLGACHNVSSATQGILQGLPITSL